MLVDLRLVQWNERLCRAFGASPKRRPLTGTALACGAGI